MFGLLLSIPVLDMFTCWFGLVDLKISLKSALNYTFYLKTNITKNNIKLQRPTFYKDVSIMDCPSRNRECILLKNEQDWNNNEVIWSFRSIWTTGISKHVLCLVDSKVSFFNGYLTENIALNFLF